MHIVHQPHPPSDDGEVDLSQNKMGSEASQRRVFIPFELGATYITPGAMRALSNEDVAKALGRHARRDWGDVDEHDRLENERSLRNECRLLSVYHTATKVKFWIITEADRATTTLLLPDEY